MSHVVYHMHYPYEADTALGYVGVTGNLPKRKWKHFNEPVNHLTAEGVSKGTVLYRCKHPTNFKEWYFEENK